jgi:hypothetical protein
MARLITAWSSTTRIRITDISRLQNGRARFERSVIVTNFSSLVRYGKVCIRATPALRCRERHFRPLWDRVLSGCFVTPWSPLKNCRFSKPAANYLHLMTAGPSFTTVTLLLASTVMCSFWVMIMSGVGPWAISLNLSEVLRSEVGTGGKVPSGSNFRS